MLTRLPILTHLVLFVLQEVARGHKMDESSSYFVHKPVVVYNCCMACNLSFMLFGMYRNMTSRVLITNENAFLYEMI